MILIPRIFHFIWLGNQRMPDESKQFLDTWRFLHPDWEIRLWTDATLPPLKNAWAYDEASRFSTKSNIARYEIVLRYGGVYLDTDIECLKNLEPLLKGVECFVARENAEIVSNAIIGAVPNHPFLRDLVDSLQERVRAIPDAQGPTMQSGPPYLTHSLKRHPEVTVYPAKLFHPYEWHEGWRRYERFPEAYAVHHWAMTWRANLLPKRKQLGDGVRPSLSVVVVARDSGIRLEWVLEGLCAQSVIDFEVIVVDAVNDTPIKGLLEAFERRLNISYHHLKPTLGQLKPAAVRNVGMAQAHAERTLFLDGDCLPDTNVVENHARFGSKGFVTFSDRRVYPASKLYRFRRGVVDYDGMHMHTFLEERRASSSSVSQDHHWRDVEGFCFSAPTEVLRQLGDFDGTTREGGAKDRTRRLWQRARRLGQRRRHRSLSPTYDGGYVTYLAHPGE
jgi:hypothetical protein